MKAGVATRTINCEIGDDLCGQLYRRVCKESRDDLEANILYVCGDDTSVLLVSLDVIGLSETAFVSGVTDAVERETGVPAAHVILACTHTHTGPATLDFLFDSPVNTTYLAKLHDTLVDGCREAVRNARDARVGWGLGRAQAGYNRRLCWADGSHSMYGDSTREDFCGLEGPDDPSHAVLSVVDDSGAVMAVVHNNCCHATCIEGDSTASADFPGEARRRLRDALGEAACVLYLQGASGDTSPWNMLQQPWRYDGNTRCEEIGALLAGESLRLVAETVYSGSVAVSHAMADLEIPVRLPDERELARAREVDAQGEKVAGRRDYVLKAKGALAMYRAYKDNPVETVRLHAVRIGDMAIITNPCEMYCCFGLDIKGRSPAAVTMVAQLTDRAVGYCPSVHAVLGGGYSAEPMHWCRLDTSAGYRIVDRQAALLRELWPANDKRECDD